MNSPLPSFRSYLSSCRATLVLISVTVFAMFVATVIVPYGFSDDYTVLWMADSREPSPQFGKDILESSAITGRALGGLILDLAMPAAGTIDNLRFLRLAAIIGIVGIALLLHWALVRAAIKPVFAALIAVFVCSMPPFQVYASWADLVGSPYAALLAGGGSICVMAAIDGPRDLVLDRLLAATILFVAGLQIYQPGAMFFWVFFAVALVGARRDSKRAFRVARAHFGVGALSLALSYLIIKVSVALIGTQTIGADRNSLTTDIPAKVHWFIHEPLFRSANLFDLTPSPWVAALVAVIAVAGMGLWLLTRGVAPLLFVGTALVLIPLTYLPNLLVQENWASIRTQASLAGLFALYASLGAAAIFVLLRDWLLPKASGRVRAGAEPLAVLVAVGVVFTSAVVAASNVTTLFAVPQITELRLLRSQVAAIPTGAQRIAFVQTAYDRGMTKVVLYDEFGLPSSFRPWVPGPEINLLLREQGRLVVGDEPIIDLYSPGSTSLPVNEPHIDLSQQLLQLR